MTKTSIHELIIDTLTSRYKESTSISGYTELMTKYQQSNDRTDREKFIFRSHPSFRGKPWYDWCMIKYETGDSTESPTSSEEEITPSNYFPAKILAIFNLPQDDNEIEGKRGDLVLLVHVCDYNTHLQDTLLTEAWYLEYKEGIAYQPELDDTTRNVLDNMIKVKAEFPILRVVCPTTIVERIMVIEEMPKLKKFIKRDDPKDSKRVVYIRNMDVWPSFFEL